jgi:uncharacterized Tic20 family protein
MWAMFCHLAGVGGLLPIIPVIGSVIAPLVIWQIKKDDSDFVDEQGKEAVNFQISVLLYALVAGLLCFACVGFGLLVVVYGLDVVFLVIAAIRANDGQHYRYPVGKAPADIKTYQSAGTCPHSRGTSKDHLVRPYSVMPVPDPLMKGIAILSKLSLPHKETGYAFEKHIQSFEGGRLCAKLPRADKCEKSLISGVSIILDACQAQNVAAFFQ